MPLTSLLGGVTGEASVVVGSSTLTLEAFLAQVTGDPKVVVGGSTMQLSTLQGGVTGDASVVIGTRTEPLSVFLGDMGTTSLIAGFMEGSSNLAQETISGNGLGGITASMGGFASPSPPTTSVNPTSYVQVGGNGGYNGTMFIGGSSGPILYKSVWVSG
jgi:hypothetical protein